MGKRKTKQSKSGKLGISSGRENNTNQPGIFKYRSQNQVAEDASIRLFLKLLPEAWIWRMIVPDYGVDMELELVEPESTVDIKGNIETLDPIHLNVTGLILWVQLKATYEIKTKDNYVLFDLETPLLRYAAGCQIPIILVLIDLKNKEVYWKHLQDYVRESSRNNNFGWWMNSSTVRIQIPKSSQIVNNESNAFIEWRQIATENTLLRELVAMQANLYRSRATLKTFTTCKQNQKQALLGQISEYLCSIYCSGLLFFDPSFAEGWELRENVLDPLIDYIDGAVEAEGHSVDIIRVQDMLEKLSGFATQISDRLSI